MHHVTIFKLYLYKIHQHEISGVRRAFSRVSVIFCERPNAISPSIGARGTRECASRTKKTITKTPNRFQLAARPPRTTQNEKILADDPLEARRGITSAFSNGPRIIEIARCWWRCGAARRTRERDAARAQAALLPKPARPSELPRCTSTPIDAVHHVPGMVYRICKEYRSSINRFMWLSRATSRRRGPRPYAVRHRSC